MSVAQKVLSCWLLSGALFAASSAGQDQTRIGAGNSAAESQGSKSPIVRSAHSYLMGQAQTIKNQFVRKQTLDLLVNANVCILHRADVDAARKQSILQALQNAGLINSADAEKFPGGMLAGVFPPVAADGLACPHPPQSFLAAPGGEFGGHHSYPGGLAIHEAFNEMNNFSLAENFRSVYGYTSENELPTMRHKITGGKSMSDHADAAGASLAPDLIIAAPIWHDWAKTIVFQWNADGTEFQELRFGGNGMTDANGAAGDSRTGAHHILSIAEAMKRGLPPELVITQASAHAAPSLGNEYKVVNWLRSAAIVAQVDVVAKGYLSRDAKGNYRLPALRHLGEESQSTPQGSQTNLLAEFALHNLSDAQYVLGIPAEERVEALLRGMAPKFGFDPANAAEYNMKYRNPVLAFLTAERLYFLYENGGVSAVEGEVRLLRSKNVI
jgi:hypothetical protein